MNNANLFPNPVDSVARFRGLSLRFRDLLHAENMRVLPFQSENLPIFSALSAEEKASAISDLSRVVEVFNEVRSAGYRLEDTLQLLWRNLRKLGYLWESDIFDKIGPGDVVQAFSHEQKMVFWNLRLLGLVSYTVEQLFCTPWWRLGSREPDVSPLIGAAIANVFGEKIKGTFDPQIPPHLLYEADSQESLRFRIHIKYVSPLRRDGRLAGFLAVNSAEEV